MTIKLLKTQAIENLTLLAFIDGVRFYENPIYGDESYPLVHVQGTDTLFHGLMWDCDLEHAGYVLEAFRNSELEPYAKTI